MRLITVVLIGCALILVKFDGPQQSNGPNKTAQLRGSQGRERIHVRENVVVSHEHPLDPHTELTIAADPHDARSLVVGSLWQPPPIDYSVLKLILYASADGGATWRERHAAVGKTSESFPDPAIAAFGPDNFVYFAYMFVPRLGYSDGSYVQLVVSQDHGWTWKSAARIEGWHDRPYLIVEGTQSRFRGRLYCTTAYGVFTSQDHARTFGPSRFWPSRPGYSSNGMMNPVVLSDGTLVVFYRDRQTIPGSGAPPASGDDYLAVRRSMDGGSSFERQERTIGMYHWRSGRDGGIPVLAVDSGSSRFKDYLYCVWTDAEPGRWRVMFSRSLDKGVSWSKPDVISEQSEISGGAGGELAKTESGPYDAFLPSVSVSNSGVVGVSWYDTRGLPMEQAGWNVRFRASSDGGATWLPSVCVTDAPTLLTSAIKRRTPKEEWPYYRQSGDTAGLTADMHGVFHPIWVDGRSGVRQVYTSAISVAP